MEINDPTHLTGHVCVDASHDEDKYQGFALSYYVMNDADRAVPPVRSFAASQLALHLMEV